MDNVNDEINKAYMNGCYLCENEETTWCEYCTVKVKILELEKQNGSK